MKKNNKKGFTLVELVIVVAVMAVLVAVAIPTVQSIVGTAETAVYDSNCRTIESMIKLEEAESEDTDLEADDIYEALNDAKLGIDNETFYYHPETGIVDGTAADDAIIIVFTEGVAAGEAAGE